MKLRNSLSLSLSRSRKTSLGGVMTRLRSNRQSANSGFTIVELLVVIVVIGILAAITIVSYTGISQKAIAVTLQSDLDNASRQIKLYQVEQGQYPTSFDANNCPVPANARYCLKASSGNTFDTTAYAATVNNSANPQTYTLDVTNTNLTKYRITNDSQPTLVSASSITAIAATTGVTTSVGSTLTAGTLTPSGATATYQWQNATTSGGTYTNISGATASTYNLAINDVGKYLKVIATGSGSYSGTQNSVASAVVSDANWLAVGNQVWGKYNLNVGTMVTGVTAQTNNATLEKYCYSNTELNCTTYGGFYQWDEAMQYVNTAGAQGICPTGSHIPSDTEWKTLEMQLGMTQVAADATGWRGTDQGTQLKPGGTSGLSMPLAGYRNTDGSFYSLSSDTFLWSSSESSTSAWNRYLTSGYAAVVRNPNGKGFGFSVRCLGN